MSPPAPKLEATQAAPTHRTVVDPLAVAVLQASSQFPGQLAFVHIAVEVRQRVQHHNLQRSSEPSALVTLRQKCAGLDARAQACLPVPSF